MNQETESWAILELMGHVRLAGRVSEVERFGSKLGRIDIPNEDGFITQFFGGSSVYRITFVTEDVARHTASGIKAQPVQPWDFPKAIAPIHRVVENDNRDLDEDVIE